MAAALVALADWWAVATGRRAVERATKPATITLLLAATLSLTPESADQRTVFVAALAFSLCGDVALLAPRRWFALGLGAFLVAHLAYVAGMLLEPGPSDSPIFGLLLAFIGGALVGNAIVRGAFRGHGMALALGVGAYLLAISATVIAAGASGDPVARIGAVALYASDGVLGWNRFVRPIRSGRLVTRIPYHLGQALMVISLLG